jgi:hypothetical protein
MLSADGIVISEDNIVLSADGIVISEDNIVLSSGSVNTAVKSFHIKEMTQEMRLRYMLSYLGYVFRCLLYGLKGVMSGKMG